MRTGCANIGQLGFSKHCRFLSATAVFAPSASNGRPSCSVSERPMPFGKQSGEGAALPRGPVADCHGSGGRAVRPQAKPRTRPAWTTTRYARRLAIDRQTDAWRTKRTEKVSGRGEPGLPKLDPGPASDHPGPRVSRGPHPDLLQVRKMRRGRLTTG